jgi:hypothetical protein
MTSTRIMKQHGISMRKPPPAQISSKRAATDRAHNATAVADFLQRALVGGALDVTQLEAMARGAGLLGRQQIQHTKAFKKAKKSLGIRSIREGFGSKGKWAWLLPAKPVTRASTSGYPALPSQRLPHPP